MFVTVMIRRFQIKEGSLLAWIAAKKLRCKKVAIVFGETIHLHNTSKEEFLSNTRWVRHELEHVRQFREYGKLRFLFLYLIESIKNGYLNNRFEVEARSMESLSPIHEL